jgi:hypothetical protein
MTAPTTCVLCGAPATTEITLVHAPTGKRICEPCLCNVGAKKHRAQDARVDVAMAAHRTEVRRLMDLDKAEA